MRDMTNSWLSIDSSKNVPGKVHAILISLAVGCVGIFFATRMTVTSGELTGTVLLFIAVIGALYLQRSDKVVAAAYTLIIALLCTGTIAVVSYGSVRTGTSIAFVGAVVAASIFLDRRALIATILIASAVFGGLTYAENIGMMTSLNRPVGFSDKSCLQLCDDRFIGIGLWGLDVIHISQVNIRLFQTRDYTTPCLIIVVISERIIKTRSKPGVIVCFPGGII